MTKKGKKEKPYGVGKSAGEIISGISRNIGRVTEKTLRQAVGRLASTMNKRLDRAAKRGESSPALDEVARSGGRFSSKGKTLEGLKSEFIRLKNFFRDPTSTKAGWEKVQRDATVEAVRRGVIKPPTPPAGGPKGSGAAPVLGAPPLPPERIDVPAPGENAPDFASEEARGAFTDLFGGGDIHGFGKTTGEQRSGWQPLPGWTWNEEKRYWEHPEYGGGWLPYEEKGGGFIDPVTGEIVGNRARSIHDYDVTNDDRRYGVGTEAGEVWRMVDSIARFDPRFKKRADSDPVSDPRMRLFNAIDDEWASHDGMSFEEARDLVAGRLDEIYREAENFREQARDLGFSTYYSDDDDW